MMTMPPPALIFFNGNVENVVVTQRKKTKTTTITTSTRNICNRKTLKYFATFLGKLSHTGNTNGNNANANPNPNGNTMGNCTKLSSCDSISGRERTNNWIDQRRIKGNTKWHGTNGREAERRQGIFRKM